MLDSFEASCVAESSVLEVLGAAALDAGWASSDVAWLSVAEAVLAP